MSVLRVIAFGAVTGLGSLSVGLVSADRLAHPAAFAARAPTIARAAAVLPEPVATGTVTQGPAVPEPAKGRMVSGFDTERLNALMRGETLSVARKR